MPNLLKGPLYPLGRHDGEANPRHPVVRLAKKGCIHSSVMSKVSYNFMIKNPCLCWHVGV